MDAQQVYPVLTVIACCQEALRDFLSGQRARKQQGRDTCHHAAPKTKRNKTANDHDTHCPVVPAREQKKVFAERVANRKMPCEAAEYHRTDHGNEGDFHGSELQGSAPECEAKNGENDRKNRVGDGNERVALFPEGPTEHHDSHGQGQNAKIGAPPVGLKAVKFYFDGLEMISGCWVHSVCNSVYRGRAWGADITTEDCRYLLQILSCIPCASPRLPTDVVWRDHGDLAI